MKRLIPTLALPLVLAAGAFAQTNYSTFNQVISWQGIHADTTDGGLNYHVWLEANASVTGADNTVYAITDIIAFYELAPGGSESSAATNPQNGWDYVLNNNQAGPGGGGVTGFDGSPGTSVTVGNPKDFTFTTAPGVQGTLGFHLRDSHITSGFLGTSGNTANVRLGAVPEPASMAALAIGALGLITRRRRRA